MKHGHKSATLAILISMITCAAHAQDFGPDSGPNSNRTGAAANATANPTSNTATKAPQKKPTPSQEAYASGLKKFLDKDYVGALADYNEAIKLNPKYGEAIGNRAACKLNTNDFKGAIADYDESLKYFPNNSTLLAQKAQAEAGLHRPAPGSGNPAYNPALTSGDYADPSTSIMMNAEKRGLVPQTVDYSDPASIIMMNARNRGLVP